LETTEIIYNSATPAPSALNNFGVQQVQLKTRVLLHITYYTSLIIHCISKLCTSYSEFEYCNSSKGFMFLFATSFTMAVKSTKFAHWCVIWTLINKDIKWQDCDKHSHPSYDKVKRMCSNTTSWHGA